MPSVDDLLEQEGHRPVELPSGANFHVFEEEVDYFVARSRQYLEQNHFTNVSDLQDIDRMLVMEVLVWRWGRWLSTGRDYWGEPVDASPLQRILHEYSRELRALKSALGIDKVTRDKQRGEDSVSAYLENLRQRAKEFGVMRESQLDKALELFNEIKSTVTLYFNTDERERVENGVKPDQVLTWLRDHVIPEYDAIDNHFRENAQKYWIRKM